MRGSLCVCPVVEVESHTVAQRNENNLVWNLLSAKPEEYSEIYRITKREIEMAQADLKHQLI